MIAETAVQQLEHIDSPVQLREWRRANELSVELIREIVRRIQHLLRSEPSSAVRLSGWAVMLAEELGEPAGNALALRARGAALHTIHENSEAIGLFDSALRIFEGLGDELQVGRTLMARMNAYTAVSRYEEALNDGERVRKIYERSGDARSLARHFQVLGNVYFRLDRFEEDLELANRAEKILEQLNDRMALADLFANRAVTLTSLNRPEPALRDYERAKQLAAENDQPIIVAECEYNVAYLYFLQGKYTQAIDKLNEVRPMMEALGRQWHCALCYLDQSEIYLELNMHRDAIELAEQAYISFERLESYYEMAKAITFMGIAHTHLQNTGKALELFDEANSIFGKEGNRVWLSLVTLYQSIACQQSGRYFEALSMAQTAYDFFAQSGLKAKTIFARVLLARIYQQLGQTDKARGIAKEALEVQSESTTPWVSYQLHHLLGDIHAGDGELEAARAVYREAIEQLEELRWHIHADELRMTFFKDKLNTYEALVRTDLAVGGTDLLNEAFEFVERSKSRTLLEMLSHSASAARRRDEAESEVISRIHRVREELNWYYTRISALEKDGKSVSVTNINGLHKEVLKREDQLLKLMRQVPTDAGDFLSLQRVTTASLDAIQQSLPERTALIEYFIVEGVIVAFVVTRAGFEFVSTGVLAEHLRIQLELFRFQLTKFNLGVSYIEQFSHPMLRATRKHLREMHSIVQPLEQVLAGNDSLIFVPHGFLHYLPFHALYDGDSHLIDRYTIAYAPSATIYRACSQANRRSSGSSLLMGIPDARTPHIKDEIDSIKAVVPDCVAVVGPEATLERLERLAPDCGTLHIASHAAFRYDNPMFSSIQLADSWMNLFDVYNLRTSADMVVLSGCATGLSAIIAGDELLGLVRGFLYTGARSLVVSLWDVHDRTTASFMKCFYSSLFEGKDRWSSLREAMLAVKSTHPHPYYWAPFMVIGSAQ